MTLTEAMDRLTEHLAQGQESYAPILTRTEATHRMALRLDKVSIADTAGNTPEDNATFARRVAQLGGICLRTLTDLDLTHAVDIPTCTRCGTPIGTEPPKPK